jgi:Flp pilus assembly protein TadG
MAKSATGESAIEGLSKSLLARFIQCSKGSIAVGIAVASPALLAVVGLAADYAVSTMKVTELQAAADAAAIAGASELAVSGSTERSIESVVQAYVTIQNNSGESHITSLAKVNRKQGTVQVVVKESWTPVFAHFLNANVTPIRVNATATLMGNGKICVLILNGAEANVLHLDNDAKLTANGCGVYSNSNHAEGIRLDANTRITSALTCSVGGFRAKNDAVKPFPLTDCPPVADPLASRSPPSVGACNFTKLKITGGNKTLAPGTYCGGLEITGSANVTFSSGVYVIKDGEFKVQDAARITGEHVTFYLTGNSSTIVFANNAYVRLTGSKEGNMAGLLFFEDRAAILGREHKINSPNVEELTGTLYLSRGALLVDPNDTVAEASAYTAIIAYELRLREGPELILNSNYGATDVPVPEGISTNAQIVLSN